MSGGGGSSSDNTIKYSPYLEAAHNLLLNDNGRVTPELSIVGAFNACLNKSPYKNYVAVNPDLIVGDFNRGTYEPLADIFKKFMSDVDVDVLWSKLYTQSTNSSEIDNAVNSHAAYLSDELSSNIIPNIRAGYRDINSVMSSAFIVAESIIEDTRLKSVAKFRADLTFKMIEIAQDRWKVHLDWNKNIVGVYAEVTKLYMTAKMDADTMIMDFATKDKLWNIKLFEYVRAMLGAMQGAATTPGLNEPSQVQKSVSGALSGAAMGAQISGGNGWATAAGAVIGLAASFA